MGCVSSKSTKDSEHSESHHEPNEIRSSTKTHDDVATHHVTNFYENCDPHTDDNHGEIKIDRPQAHDAVDDDTVEHSSDHRATPGGPYLQHQPGVGFKAFTPRQKKEVTALLNRIEQMANEQGLFGELGKKQRGPKRF